MKCLKCQTENTKAFSYCNSCGSKLTAEPEVDYNISLTKTKVFFFTLLGYIALLHFVTFENTYIVSLITDLIFATIITTFFFLNYKKVMPVLTKGIGNFKLLAGLLVSLILFAFCISHLADFLNQSSFNDNNSSYYEHYKDSPFTLFFSILSIGVFPAVFEEIAFRGILFNELRNLMSEKAVIIITALLFTLLHLSFISFFWILPAGLLFGYLRSKYNTLLYGILGHFVYNSSIVLIEYFNL